MLGKCLVHHLVRYDHTGLLIKNHIWHKLSDWWAGHHPSRPILIIGLWGHQYVREKLSRNLHGTCNGMHLQVSTEAEQRMKPGAAPLHTNGAAISHTVVFNGSLRQAYGAKVPNRSSIYPQGISQLMIPRRKHVGNILAWQRRLWKTNKQTVIALTKCSVYFI